MSAARIPLAAVLGHPVAHSKSPRLHHHWLSRHGLPGHYIPIDVTGDDLAAALRLLPRLGFVGVNVTVPHKERALDLADLATDRASLIGAANTLVFRRDGRIHADNTDGYGFVANLEQAVPDWRPDAAPALVLGAGGAARAVLAALLDKGVPRIDLANRTRLRAEALRNDFGTRVHVVDWVHAGAAVGEAGLVVNATSLGMTGKPALTVPMDRLRPGTIVNDLVYAPLRTPLLAAAEAAGARPVDGLGMLLHQAVPAFERFFGERPEVDDAARAALLA